MIHNDVQHTPNWHLETISCILESDGERENEIYDNCEKFGMDREEMISFLSPVVRYKDAVLKELLPIYEHFKCLKRYVKYTAYERERGSLLYNFVAISFSKLMKEFREEDIDKIFNEKYMDLFQEFINDETAQIKINNLSDVVRVVNNIQIEDEFKMRLIGLYSERYEFCKELREFFIQSEGMCEKHFLIIQKKYEEAVMEIEDSDSLEEVLRPLQILSVRDDSKAIITPMIFCFNQLMLECNENEYFCFTGIFLFPLRRMKKDNRFHSARLVAELKALGDATRIKIIQLLSSRVMYIQELADELNLTSATVSHHINILLHVSLIRITMDKTKAKKIYYEVNKEKMELLGETIQKIANDVVD